MATIEPAINSVAYFFHERVWQRNKHNVAPLSITKAVAA